jgi:hypothetical protein
LCGSPAWATSGGPGNLIAPMIHVLLILSALVPLALALVGLCRFALVKYRRWRRRNDVPLVRFL